MVDNPHASTRFFKVILPPTDGQTKLRIPRKFAGDYGRELSGVVKLTCPTGGVWCIRLEKIGDLLWLCDGWEKFANDHSISYGYFLIFEYKRNSTFNVLIFDLTATEVDYAIPMNDEISDDESLQVLDFFSAKSNEETCNLLSSFEDLAGGVKTGRSYVVERTDTKGKSKMKDNWQSSSNEPGPSSSMESQSQNEAVDVGAKYLPKNPSFTVILKKNKPPSSLWVPTRVSKHLRAPGQIELVDCDGKKWPVRIGQRKCNFVSRYLSTGWMTFVRQKNLLVGGTCVFELIDNDERTLKVSTFYKLQHEERLELTSTYWNLTSDKLERSYELSWASSSFWVLVQHLKVVIWL